MNFQTMSKQRKFVLIAAAVGIISVFLPWLTISVFGVSNSVNGFRSYGIVVFLAFAAAIAVSLLGDQTRTFDQNRWMLAMGTGVIALLFTILFYSNINGALGMADVGIGLWISLVAALGVTGSAWMYRNPSDTLKGGFDNIKKSFPSATNQPSDTTPPPSNRMNELERLINLKNEGKISEEEYQQLKSKLL